MGLLIDTEDGRESGGLRTFSVFSYYTPDYEDEAATLRQSMRKVDLDPKFVREMDGLGAWAPNKRFLPMFLERIHKKRIEATVWVEADSVFHSHPWAFNASDADIAVVYHNGKPLSSVIFLAPSDTARAFLTTWVDITMHRPEMPIAESLHRILADIEGLDGVTIEKLPASYAGRPGADDEVVIENTNASRKRGIGPGVVDFAGGLN